MSTNSIQSVSIMLLKKAGKIYCVFMLRFFAEHLLKICIDISVFYSDTSLKYNTSNIEQTIKPCSRI